MSPDRSTPSHYKRFVDNFIVPTLRVAQLAAVLAGFYFIWERRFQPPEADTAPPEGIAVTPVSETVFVVFLVLSVIIFAEALRRIFQRQTEEAKRADAVVALLKDELRSQENRVDAQLETLREQLRGCIADLAKVQQFADTELAPRLTRVEKGVHDSVTDLAGRTYEINERVRAIEGAVGQAKKHSIGKTLFGE